MHEEGIYSRYFKIAFTLDPELFCCIYITHTPLDKSFSPCICPTSVLPSTEAPSYQDKLMTDQAEENYTAIEFIGQIQKCFKWMIVHRSACLKFIET